jgi:hypothetical protein
MKPMLIHCRFNHISISNNTAILDKTSTKNVSFNIQIISEMGVVLQNIETQNRAGEVQINSFSKNQLINRA